MKVYSPEGNYKLKKILLVAKIYKKHINVQQVDFEPKIAKSFKQQYPQYSLPLLETEDGKFINGTNAILLFLSAQNSKRNLAQKAKNIQQLQIIERQIDTATGVLILSIKKYPQLTEEQIQKSKQIISKYLKDQNDKLSLKTFLTGDELAVADISSYHNILAIKEVFDKDIEKLKNLSRWMKQMEGLDKL